MSRPAAIYCLWECDTALLENPRRDTYGKLWKFVEAYGVDQDGYACTPSKHASRDRHSYDKWMNRDSWYVEATKEVVYTCPEGQDPQDGDPEPMPGRVVTGWTVEGGIFLAAFNPPTRVLWLDPFLGEQLAKTKNWTRIIHDGGTLYLGTARAVEKLLDQLAKPKKPKGKKDAT